MAKTYRLDWRCHTPRLFEEMMINPGMEVFSAPLRIFRGILTEVAQRAIELDDDKLSLLMLRLTMYDCADPQHENYDPKAFERLEKSIRTNPCSP